MLKNVKYSNESLFCLKLITLEFEFGFLYFIVTE